MRYCAVPRVNHLLRGCPPSLVEEMALLHDRRIMSCFSRLLGPGNPLCCDVTQSPAHVTDGFGLEQEAPTIVDSCSLQEHESNSLLRLLCYISLYAACGVSLLCS